MIIRDILNKILWDSKEHRFNYEITFIHRGAYLDEKHLSCSLIKEVKSSWFTYDSENEGEVVIPFHRILLILNISTRKTIWKKTTRTKSISQY